MNPLPQDWRLKVGSNHKDATPNIQRAVDSGVKYSEVLDSLNRSFANPAAPASLTPDASSSARLNELGEYLSGVEPHNAEQVLDLQTAQIARVAAGLAYADGDKEGGDALSTVSWMFGRIAAGIKDQARLFIGLSPLGLLQDVYEAVTGKDLYGNELDSWDRAFSVVSAISGGLASKAKYGIKALRKLAEIRQGSKIANETVKVFDAALEASKTGKLSAVGKGWRRKFSLEATRDAEIVNRERKLTKLEVEPPYQAGTMVRQIRTISEEQFVRVYSENSSQFGEWIMRKEAIAGLTPQQIMTKYNLKYLPTHVTDVAVPAGTLLEMGRVGANALGKTQGAIQYSLKETLPRTLFTKPRVLKDL